MERRKPLDGPQSGAAGGLAGIAARIEADLPGSMAGQTVEIASTQRAQNVPSELTGSGQRRGTWKDGTFVLDDAFVPKRHNPEGLTVGEIRTRLQERYGLSLGGIPFDGGVADFSGIAVANISTADIAARGMGMDPAAFEALPQREKLEKYKEAFRARRRTPNFKIADQLAAERHIPIPGLGSDYTEEELRRWREENGFSWDEQLHGGYSLVPAVIHGNVTHSGLVSTAKRAHDALSELERDIVEHPEEYCFADDENTPISIQELEEASGRA